MDEFELKRMIYDYVKEICHFSQMQVFANSSDQNNYFQAQIDETIDGLMNFLQAYLDNTLRAEKMHPLQILQEGQNSQGSNASQPSTDQQEGSLREISMEELAANDGSDGKPAYVAVNGNVYDVSMVIRWAGGNHFGLRAGHDLSNEFNSCHRAMLGRLDALPKIGVLQK